MASIERPDVAGGEVEKGSRVRPRARLVACRPSLTTGPRPFGEGADLHMAAADEWHVGSGLP
jgi:hypothetical protein